MVHPVIARLVEHNCRTHRLLQALNHPDRPSTTTPRQPPRADGRPTDPPTDRPRR
ncbi:hypothetical protein [Actinomadura sp. KC216]|uniref:hypothetical protein n=1 Tax=Actinomadura sp. KC216 TaxID=2530370 RepID=UPI0014044780|nr:hypothetical protein [Actinomadura sp. KC216]